MEKKQPLTRRKFIGAALAGIPVVVTIDRVSAQSRELTPDDPRYAALGYYPDAADVDPAKEPLFAPDRDCKNCSQIRGDDENAVMRPCALFPDLQDPTQYLLVANAGWCRSWIAMN